MKDMISKIVDMDEKAQGLSLEAQKSKVDASQEVNLMKEKIRKEYLEKARKRIQMNKKHETKLAEKELKLLSQRNEEIMSKLESAYEQNCDDWVDSIVKRVIEE